jgi:molecular chaperone DnaK (HSP70)
VNLFKKTLEPFKLVIESSALKKNEIDVIVLLTFSTKIRQLFKEFFGGNNQTPASTSIRLFASVPPSREETSAKTILRTKIWH